MAFSEDISVFFDLDGFAVSASWTPSGGGATQTAQVLLDRPDQELLDGRVLSREYAIVYAATQLVALKGGENLTVNSVSYKVREVTALDDDGSIFRATLSKN